MAAGQGTVRGSSVLDGLRYAHARRLGLPSAHPRVLAITALEMMVHADARVRQEGRSLLTDADAQLNAAGTQRRGLEQATHHAERRLGRVVASQAQARAVVRDVLDNISSVQVVHDAGTLLDRLHSPV